ncbi:DUF11 domain-containing protein [Clostridium sp. 1001275B_160808_H3]|uniref:DUF11 domain-containing protein n=1 Tax=Clostridium sp. 1001275B_160808_H3 TaxID=2787110 RepID=UPI001897259E|nr:DUF11 domain-containing protein [Clostridium sp. 1001275B_160808_H3]
MNKKLKKLLAIFLFTTYIFSMNVFAENNNILALTYKNIDNILDENKTLNDEITNNQVTENQDCENQVAEDQATNDQDTEGQDTNDQDTEDQDTNNQATEDQDTNDQDTEDQDTNDQDAEDQDTNNQATEDQDTNDQDAENQATNDQDTENQVTNDATLIENLPNIESTESKAESKATIITISTEDELKNMKPTSDYELANDITLSSDWIPIKEFYGSLNGNGHTISNVSINIKGSDNLGFINKLMGTIENIIFQDVSIDSSIINSSNKITSIGSNLGAVAVYNYGNINEVSVIGLHMVGARYMGGISAYNYGTISNSLVSMQSCGKNRGIYSYNIGDSILDERDLNGTKTANFGGQYIGGIVGLNISKIIGCMANVNILFGQYIGGIVGMAESGKVTSSYATGYLSGWHDVGGIAGVVGGDSNFYNIYSSVELDGYGEYKHVAAIGHSNTGDMGIHMKKSYQDIQMGTGGSNYLNAVGQPGLELLLGYPNVFFGKLDILEGLLTKDMIYNNWNPGGDIPWTTIDGYYPQLEHFALNENPIIRKASANSVQAVVLSTPDDFSLIGKADVSSKTLTDELWNQIDTWKYVRYPFYMSPNNIGDFVNDWKVLEQGNYIEEEIIDINKTNNKQYLGDFTSNEITREVIGVSTNDNSNNICKKIILYGTGNALNINKTVNATSAEKGKELEYTITVTNEGILPIIDVDVIDIMAIDYNIDKLKILFDYLINSNIKDFKDKYYEVYYNMAITNAQDVLNLNSPSDQDIKNAYSTLLNAIKYLNININNTLEGLSYQHLENIAELNVNESKTYIYKVLVPENQNGGIEYYNVAIANSGKLIDNDDKSLFVPQNQLGLISITKEVANNVNNDKFTIYVKGDKFETYIQLADGETIQLEVPYGTYMITEILSKDYKFLNATYFYEDNISHNMYNGDKVSISENNNLINVKFINEFNKKKYFHGSSSKTNIFS